MFENLLVVYVLALIAIGFATVTLVASAILRPKVADPIKLTTYECGIEATGSTEVKHNIRFYIFALLFVIFDVEALFVIPWAVSAGKMTTVALYEMLVFLTILFVGLLFAWGKGALTWE
jgi:NADH-quinone oxidoreductase subunit A